MKRVRHSIKTDLIVLCLLSFPIFYACTSSSDESKFDYGNSEYYVAAYIWPSCHDEEMSRDKLWVEGIGEWEMIQKGNPCFDGHYQPRIPLWGYKMDDDPLAWEQKINAATDHGVNTFIFDWYWYDGKPYLEEAIDSGFLEAGNNNKMNFYLMWANHDVPGNMWNHYRYKTDSLLWQGEVDWENYKIIVARVIKQYFKKPNYFKINNEPVFSIYNIREFYNSFNGAEGAKEALDYFRSEVKKEGFPGLHVQVIGHDSNIKPSLGVAEDINIVVKMLDINSVTMYNMAGKRNGDYLTYAERAITLRNRWDSLLNVPFIPCISVGWDNTPRYPELGRESIIHTNNTPYSFEAYLQKTKEYVKKHPEQPKMIIINAWNEWVEGSYLEPDMLWGYGYLQAVKRVMSGEYDSYSYR